MPVCWRVPVVHLIVRVQHKLLGRALDTQYVECSNTSVHAAAGGAARYMLRQGADCHPMHVWLLLLVVNRSNRGIGRRERLRQVNCCGPHRALLRRAGGGCVAGRGGRAAVQCGLAATPGESEV